jgi:acetyltransferase-like isoleucine patch superfamily enzyme
MYAQHRVRVSFLRVILKNIVKTIIAAIRNGTALPIAFITALVAIFLDHRNRYIDVAVLLAYLPFKWGEYVRYYFYRITLESVGSNCIFKFGSFCNYRNTKIGHDVFVGFYTILSEVTIGNNVLLGGRVFQLSGGHQHSYDDSKKPINQQAARRTRINIGDDVWVGSSAIIMADIGSKCVVGAGTVVTKKVEDGTVVVGNPARLLKRIDPSVLRTNDGNSG